MSNATVGKASVTSQLSVSLPALDYQQLRSRAARADEAGFTWVSVGDNPVEEMEQYISLAVLAHATTGCRIGTAVTTANHRDPLIVATALSSVERVAPGRVFMGIATGRARQPGTLRALEEHVALLRALWRGDSVSLDGENLALGWDAKPVPILVCASGPRGLRLAGRIADGVIVESGVEREAAEQAKAWVTEGAREAGRDPAALEMWWYLKAAIANTADEARTSARRGLAISGARVAGANPAARAVPESFWTQTHALADWYASLAHNSRAVNRDLTLDDDPFLEYLTDRFGLVGTPDDWLRKLEELRDRGIERVFCVPVGEPDRLVDLVADTVLPRLRQSANASEPQP